MRSPVNADLIIRANGRQLLYPSRTHCSHRAWDTPGTLSPNLDPPSRRARCSGRRPDAHGGEAVSLSGSGLDGLSALVPELDSLACVRFRGVLLLASSLGAARGKDPRRLRQAAAWQLGCKLQQLMLVTDARHTRGGSDCGGSQGNSGRPRVWKLRAALPKGPQGPTGAAANGAKRKQTGSAEGQKKERRAHRRLQLHSPAAVPQRKAAERYLEGRLTHTHTQKPPGAAACRPAAALPPSWSRCEYGRSAS